MQDENRNLAKIGDLCPVLRGFDGENDKEETA